MIKDKRKREQKKLEEETEKLTTRINEIKKNKIFQHSFEWRFEFPETLDNEDLPKILFAFDPFVKELK